jgi:hypothetical protein
MMFLKRCFLYWLVMAWVNRSGRLKIEAHAKPGFLFLRKALILLRNVVLVCFCITRNGLTSLGRYVEVC